MTGNLGDSYIGLRILNNKIKVSKSLRNYFINKYFQPDIKIDLAKFLIKFAHTSIDISDGLITDLEKMINVQKFSYLLKLDDIPISNYLASLII